MSRNSAGFEGICRTRDLERLAGLDIAVEIPTLSQICVAVMKANTVNSPRKGRDSGL